jgi:Chlorophyllase
VSSRSTTAVPSVAYRPVVLRAPDRPRDLQLRVCAPESGGELPVVLFSHGFGSSMDAYGPLTDHWAANGFAVIQPTHLDSVSLGLAPDDPSAPLIWRHRIADLARILDELDRIEASVPGLGGRLDRDRVAATGHSYGATTASALIGAHVVGHDEDLSDPRVSAGILLAVAGTGGENLTPFAAENFSFMNPGFDAMAPPALIVAGDHDQSMLSTRGPDWWTDAYALSPGEKSLLTLFGAEHSLGGIDAYGGMPHTPADSPALVALVQQMTTAYLRTALGVDESSWPAARDGLAHEPQARGRVKSR